MAFHSGPLLNKKVLFIMGSTGTRKTKLSINIDKIQVYKGLDIVVNMISESERRGITHHLLGFIDNPKYNYTVDEFCNDALDAIELILGNGHLPIIVGGSNSYLKALVEDPKNEFHTKYECCFIWFHVSLHVLFQVLDKRVDQMLDSGLVNEIRRDFDPNANYSLGIRRAIVVPEFDQYIQVERGRLIKSDEAYKEMVLQDAC